MRQRGFVSEDKGGLSQETRGVCLGGQGGVVSWDKGGLSRGLSQTNWIRIS